MRFTTRFWIPDALFGGGGVGLFESIETADTVELQGYLTGVTAFARQGRETGARWLAEGCAVESEHRAIARFAQTALGGRRQISINRSFAPWGIRTAAAHDRGARGRGHRLRPTRRGRRRVLPVPGRSRGQRNRAGQRRAQARVEARIAAGRSITGVGLAHGRMLGVREQRPARVLAGRRPRVAGVAGRPGGTAAPTGTARRAPARPARARRAVRALAAPRDAPATCLDREIDDLATQAATTRSSRSSPSSRPSAGRSRFTTWAYKFVILEAAVKARRRAWEEREVSAPDRDWRSLGPSAQQMLEEAELLAVVGDAVRTRLTPHQRTVFTAAPSTTSRSTCSPSGWAPPAARSTSRCTTRVASCAPRWPRPRRRRRERRAPPRPRRAPHRSRRSGDRLPGVLRATRRVRRPRARGRDADRRCRACAPISTAAAPAARSTTACARW